MKSFQNMQISPCRMSTLLSYTMFLYFFHRCWQRKTSNPITSNVAVGNLEMAYEDQENKKWSPAKGWPLDKNGYLIRATSTTIKVFIFLVLSTLRGFSLVGVPQSNISNPANLMRYTKELLKFTFTLCKWWSRATLFKALWITYRANDASHESRATLFKALCITY